MSFKPAFDGNPQYFSLKTKSSWQDQVSPRGELFGHMNLSEKGFTKLCRNCCTVSHSNPCRSERFQNQGVRKMRYDKIYSVFG